MSERTVPDPEAFDGRIAKTSVTSFRVVEALKAGGTVGVSEVAEELSIGKATAHKHLSTLRKMGYAVRTDDGKYRLSLAFLGLGTSVRARMPLYGVVHEPLEKLAEATGEVASVMVPEHGRGVYLSRVTNEKRPVLDRNEGERVPLAATAGGKAILAYLPDTERERIFDEHGLPRFTENTITGRAALSDELQSIRDKRMARDRGEFDPDRYCVAAPVTDQRNDAVAAVSVSGPVEQMSRTEARIDIPSIVGSTASAIQNRLSS